MAFMEPQIEHGLWYEIDGPVGTEFVPADLIGSVTIERPDGSRKVKAATLDDLQEYDRAMGLTQEDEGDDVRFPIPFPAQGLLREQGSVVHQAHRRVGSTTVGTWVLRLH